MALVGMAAMVAATTSAPMTAAIMTYEMTLDYQVVLPIMVGVAVAYSVRRYFSKGDIYTLKLIRRGQHVPHGFLADMNSHIMVNDIMDSSVEVVKPDDVVTGSDTTYCVVDDENKMIGIVIPVSYRKGVEFRAKDAMVTAFIPIRAGLTLRDALYDIARHDCPVAVVTVDGSLDADKISGVFDSSHLTRVIARSAHMHEYA
jgi:CIC family chloride channel protein